MGHALKEDPRQNFTVALDRATHRRLKIQAAEERRPMTSIIHDAVRNYLDLAQNASDRYPAAKK